MPLRKFLSQNSITGVAYTGRHGNGAELKRRLPRSTFALRGCARKQKLKKSEISMEVGGSRSHSKFFGENHPKIALNQY